MQLSDITVEVRDRDLSRVGAVPIDLLDLTATGVRNNVGSWSLTLPVESPLAVELSKPGAGIILRGPDGVMLSGPCDSRTVREDAETPAGVAVFKGRSDDHVLSDRLAYPDPSQADVNAQSVAEDIRSGVAETVIREFVDVNLGPGAVPARRVPTLSLAPDLGRGPVVSKAARFEKVGEIIDDIAAISNLSFQVRQEGGGLLFTVDEQRDQSKLVRFDVLNNTLASHEVTVEAPTATVAIVGGRGEGADRWFYESTSDANEVASWGRREVFLDHSSSDDDEELEQAARELFANAGYTSVNVRAVPMDHATMRFGDEWRVGDLVSIVNNGVESATTVSGWILKANAEGVFMGAVLGDPSAASEGSRQQAQWDDTIRRVSQIERRLEVIDRLAWDRLDDVPSSFPPSAHGHDLTDVSNFTRSSSATRVYFGNGPNATGSGNTYLGMADSSDAIARAAWLTHDNQLVFAFNKDGSSQSSGPFNAPNLPIAMASGQVSITPPAGGGIASTTVTFPPGVFSGTPNVVATALTSAPGTVTEVGVTNRSASGCTIHLHRTSGTATSIDWIAVQS